MGIDLKYGKVTLENSNVGEDEPVVVFRATDKLLPKVLAYYHSFCLKDGSPRHHLDLILDSREAVIAWQQEHGSRVPNSDAYIARKVTG